MSPIDFVVFDGNSSPNEPVYKIHEAMKKPIKILSSQGEMKVISYYFHKGQMILDLEKKGF